MARHCLERGYAREHGVARALYVIEPRLGSFVLKEISTQNVAKTGTAEECKTYADRMSLQLAPLALAE